MALPLLGSFAADVPYAASEGVSNIVLPVTKIRELNVVRCHAI